MNQETIQGYRLSPQQRQLWTLRRGEDSAPYYSWCAIKIEGLRLAKRTVSELDRSLLKQALAHVVTQYEILRTTFRLLPGMTIPVQVIAEEASVAPIVLTEHEAPSLVDPSRIHKPRENRPAGLPALQADLLSGAILVLQAPSLYVDGPSLQILARQIVAAYGALQRGAEPAAIEAMQYADFAEWQNEMLESADGLAGRQYWQRLDLQPALARRMVFERNDADARFQPQTMLVPLSAVTIKQVEELAQKTAVSVTSLFLACWQIFLERSNGWDEPMSGVAFDGRKFDELKESIGLLSNFLPIQSDLTKPLEFVALLRQLNGQLDEAQKYQEYFSWEQAINGAGFFPYCFEFRTLPPAFVEGGLAFTIERQDSCLSAFKLKFICEQRTQETVAKLEYDPNVFSPNEIRLFADRLSTVIAHVIRNPAASTAGLELLGSEEQHLLREEFNNSARENPAETRPLPQVVLTNPADARAVPQALLTDPRPPIHRMFEAQVAQNPQGIAVVFEDEQVTYAELNARANRLAHHLRGLGVGPDEPVALAIHRSIDLIVALLGILKAGGAYVPLDPGFPQTRLAMMIIEAGARILVTRGELAGGLRDKVDHVLCLDENQKRLAHEGTENLVDLSSSQNLVYIIFTSGSTGKPKGVAVEHRQLLNYLNAIREKLDLGEGCSFATVSTLAADLGNTVLFPPLCFGGTLHLISEERATNPDAFVDYCLRHPIDYLKIVPSHLSALLSAANPAEVLPRRRLVLGGEASSWSLIESIKTLAPDCEILNHYGPTEATVGVVCYDVDLSASSHAETVPLGRPLANTRVYILDEAMRLAPLGAPGELHLGGAGVARGYINRPEATAEKFAPDPFGGNGLRLYKTGDRARYLSDGRIEFLGRVDDQVKIHGFRIEPREVEMALRDHAALKACVVVAREDAPGVPGGAERGPRPSSSAGVPYPLGWTPGEKRLVAYCVAKDQQTLDANELRAFLRGRLPEYMIPSAFVFLRQLPLTANGKIDRQALPAPDRVRSDSESAHAAPRNQVEETLARLWTTVLGVERVGINDNFFELGGDSILSIQIIARANQAGLRLSPRQLFQHQTIAELASVAGASAQVAAEQGLVTGEVPLTPIQARFFAQEQPAPHHYNQAMLLEISESLDGAVLERALATILTHHDALRLRFKPTANGWAARIADPEPVTPFVEPFVEIDLSNLDLDDQQTEFQMQTSALQASLNLQDGPLVRAALLNLMRGRPRYLLIVIHHLATDGVSWSVLLEDLRTLCRQIASKEGIQLPPKTTSFKYWSERLLVHAKSDALLAEETHWLSLSENAHGDLPFDGEGVNTAATARTVAVALDENETRALLQEVPAALRTQINEVLLTALARTLAGWSGSQRVLLDLEGHGREDVFEGVDLSRTVGWFTTVFPVLLDLSDSQTPIDALRLVKEQLRAIPNRGLGYGLLRYTSGNERLQTALAAQPQAEVRFNYLGQLDRALPESALFKAAPETSDNGLRLTSGQLQSPLNERGYLLNIIGSVSGGALRLEWTYSANRHRREVIENLAASYLRELRALIGQAQKAGAESFSPSDFPSAKLSQDDLSKVLAQLRNREQ